VFSNYVGARCLFGLCLAVSPSAAFAGAWTMEAGKGQAIVTGTLSAADAAFNSSGSTQPIPRYRKFELQGLIEYGATDRLTLMAAPGLQHVDIAGPAEAQRTGLGFSEFGARYLLLQGDSWVFSGQTTLRVPGTFQKANPAAVGYTDTEADVRGLLGYSFAIGAVPAFIDLQLAQRFRFGAPPSEFRADLTFGIRPLPQWLLLAQLFNVVSEGGGEPGFVSYDYSKLQLSVVYDLNPQWSVQFGGFTTVAGHNALQEKGIILGTWYRF
jgi:hypothetical protein